MDNIKRTDFHHNFLKSVIVRLDFQGVLEPEMEKILLHVKPFVKEKGFSRYIEKVTNQINIDVMNNGDLESIETTNRVRRQKVYSFINEDKGFVLEVSNSFICLMINTTHYTPFDEYSNIIPFISKIYKDNIDFFTVMRFGIRKKNECFIKDKTSISKYFNKLYFNYYDGIDSLNTIQSNHTNIFNYDKYHINLLTNIIQGKSDGKILYCVQLDIDAYLTNSDDIFLILDKQEEQNFINNLIFDIYKSSLTDDFISLLTSDDFDTTLMLGVERND